MYQPASSSRNQQGGSGGGRKIFGGFGGPKTVFSNDFWVVKAHKPMKTAASEVPLGRCSASWERQGRISYVSYIS